MSPRRDRVQEIIDRVLADRQEDTGKDTGDLVRFWREYVRPSWPTVIVLSLIVIIWSVTPFGFSLTYRFLVDEVLGGEEGIEELRKNVRLEDLYHGVWFVFIANMLLHTINFACTWGHRFLSLRLAQGIALTLRGELYEKLETLHIGYYERTQTGRIMSRMQGDVQALQQFVHAHLSTAVGDCNKLVSGLVFLAWLNMSLTWFVVMALPLYGAAYVLLRPRIRSSSRAVRRIASRLWGLTVEKVAAIRVVQAFTQEKREYLRFARMVHDAVRVMLRYSLLSQILNLIVVLVTRICMGLVLWYGLTWVRDDLHGMTLGDVLAYVTAMMSVFAPVAALTGVAAAAQTALVSLRRIFSLLDEEEEVLPGATSLEGTSGRIEFDDVSFTYPHQTDPALEDFTLRIEPGERVALMGPSGSGKSTVFQLLLRFYDPDEGVVRIGGTDLREADPKSVRRHVRLVQQESFIFSGTLAENVTFGSPEATPKEIMRATEMAELHEFIMSLPLKYETAVGEHGMSLSGGQKQRLALATALLTDPEVLLLDDSTSALDAATEARIRATLNRVMENRTSLIITQRIATARGCDRIVVLESGRITQSGTHDELKTADGFYRGVYEQQSSL